MTLTKIKTDGVKDDAITSDKIADNAVTTNKIADNAVTFEQLASNTVKTGNIEGGAVITDRIADQAVTLAKLEHGTSSNNGKFLRANNGADPTFETVNTDLVSDTSPQLGGDLQSNGNDIDLADNDKIVLGTDGDITLRHNGAHFLTTNNTGDVNIGGANSVGFTTNNHGAWLVKGTSGGASSLYYSGNEKLATTNTGVSITGNVNPTGHVALPDDSQLRLGSSDDLKIYHANGNTSSYVSHENGSGYLFLEGDAIQLRTRSASNNEVYVNCNHNAQVELYYNNGKAVETKDLSASGDSGELGIKFVNKKAIQFHQNTMGIFTFSFSMSANTWTTMYTHDSYMSVTINVASIHNAGFSSATWIVSKSASGGNSLVRTGLNNAYSPAALEFRINGSDLQIRSSYGTYGYGLCLASYNMDGVRNISN